jgi:hypothetical protein
MANEWEWADLQPYWPDSVVLSNSKAVNTVLEATVKSLLYLASDDPDIRLETLEGEPSIYVIARDMRPIERFLTPAPRDEILATFEI